MHIASPASFGRRPGRTPCRDARALIALAACLGIALAPPALADPPEREKPSAGTSELFPAGSACPEAIAPEGVRVTRLGGTGGATFFGDGRVLFSGRHPDEFLNVATGKSVVLALQGGGVLVPHDDGSADLRLSGKTVFVFFPGDVGPGDDATGRTYLFTGTVRIVLDPSGAVVAFESSGRSRDVCALLA